MRQHNGQPGWDIYEAVILLDGYLETLNGNRSAQVIRRISSDLRQMATNRGMEIDNSYRSVSGIAGRIGSMASAYAGKTIDVPASKIFSEAAEMYRTDKEKYFDILSKAKNMVARKQSNKDAFLAWAKSVFPSERCKWIEENILKTEQFALDRNFISGSVFDITDTATLSAVQMNVEKNKFFQKNQKIIYIGIT